MSERLRRLKMRLPRFKREKGSWSVCSTVAEPPEMLFAFVSHYLDLGAREVHLFIDDPDQLGLETLSKIEGVRLTICDDAYWAKVNGKRPDGQVMRQLRNANLAYENCQTDWFFFCDADEFFVSNKPVSQLLNAVPADIVHCRTAMAERVFSAEQVQTGLFDGILRLPLVQGQEVLRAVYGDLAPMTTRGLLGHAIGKSFVRSGHHDQRIRIHFPVPMDGEEENRLRMVDALKPGPELEGGRLVHFDGMTPLHWRLKLLRYYLNYAPKLAAGNTKVFGRRTSARSRQLNAVYEAQGDPAILARLMPLIRPDAQMVAQLAQAGGILDMAVDPGAAARRRISPELEFSSEEFDARLHRRYGDLIAEYKLEA